jgi:FkbM family methyltransferase
MQRLMTGLIRVIEYARALGTLRGIKTFLVVYLSPRVEKPVTIDGSRPPVILRRGTSDRLVFEQVFIGQEYEGHQLTRQPRTIVDAGANIGLSSICFALKYPAAKILAIEPDIRNYRMLVRNSQPYANIEPVHGALWATKTSVAIANLGDSPWAYRVDDSEGSATGSSVLIDTITMPEVISWAEGTIDLLKLDIEGAEYQLFSSDSPEWVNSVETIVVELHDWLVPGCSMGLYRAIQDWDFDQYVSHENLYIVRRPTPQ